MNSALSSTLRTWVEESVQKILEEALGQTTSTPSATIPDMASNQTLSEINSINTKIGKIMATLADLQSVIAAEEVTEAKLITVLQTVAANNASLAQQLEAAVAGGDSAGIQASVDKLKSDTAVMEAAIAQAMPANATPPGQPKIT